MSESFPQKFVRFVMRVGGNPGDSDETHLQKTLLIFSSFMMASLSVGWGLIYIAFGEYLAGAIPLFYSILSFLSIILFALTHRYRILSF